MDHKSKTYEEAKLREIIDFAAARAESAGAELRELEGHIEDMLARYNSDNTELYNQLVVATDMEAGLRELVGRCRRAQHSPYFGRVDFSENGAPARELYIGRGGLYDDEAGTPVVIDWRTPIANLYYDSQLGDTQYVSQGVSYPGVLELKRTYSISDGRLQDYYDADLVTSDELLQAYLAKNADAVLRDIVATIQKDQNEIIRIPPWNDVIVQGVAGSGKTTVAMHRLAFLIFNYAREMKPSQYAIIGSNRMFLGYVSGMLPDLGVEQVTQMLMPELLLDYLKLPGPAAPTDQRTAPLRSTSAFFQGLQTYLDKLEADMLLHELRLGDRLLFGRGELEERILGGLKKPLLKKAELLNEWLAQRVRDTLPLLENRLEAECDAAIRAIRNGSAPEGSSIAGAIDRKHEALDALKKEAAGLRNIYMKRIRAMKEARVYKDYLATLGLKAPKTPDVYDLSALSYIAFRLRPMTGSLKHIIVDEAQDFGPMLYRCLTEIYSDAGFTILGDLSQNIGDGVGLQSWEEVLETAFSGRKHRFCVLSKSYRNTVEIAETANRVIARAEGPVYHAQPVVRHGEAVEHSAFPDAAALEAAAAAEARRWQGGSLALICPTAAAARRLHAKLPEAGLILAGTEESYTGGVTVFDADSVKGLEFDRVLVCGTGSGDYPATARGIRLLYVVLTRALHSLHILSIEGEDGLLST